IRDLDSRNGTFVNGVPVTERALQHGDQIGIAASVLVFLVDDTVPPAPALAVQLAETECVGRSLALAAREAVYLSDASSPGTLPLPSRAARDLKALLSVGTAVGSCASVEAFAGALIEAIFPVLAAERGVLLLLGASDDFVSTIGRTRSGKTKGPIRVSQTIV